MPTKNEAEVLIGGKVITLSGYESREYIQKVAAYLDNKLDEHKKMESYKKEALNELEQEAKRERELHERQEQERIRKYGLQRA